MAKKLPPMLGDSTAESKPDSGGIRTPNPFDTTGHLKKWFHLKRNVHNRLLVYKCVFHGHDDRLLVEALDADGRNWIYDRLLYV